MAQYNYEWDIETVAVVETDDYEEGDIIDHDHMDTPRLPDADENLVLVCDAYYADGQSQRSWAYVEDGKMETYFRDAYERMTIKIPQKFHNQLKREVGK
jgi:hypothetical protein